MKLRRREGLLSVTAKLSALGSTIDKRAAITGWNAFSSHISHANWRAPDQTSSRSYSPALEILDLVLARASGHKNQAFAVPNRVIWLSSEIVAQCLVSLVTLAVAALRNETLPEICQGGEVGLCRRAMLNGASWLSGRHPWISCARFNHRHRPLRHAAWIPVSPALR